MKITTEFRFEGAHQLAHLPEGHKCKRLHGHNWRMVVAVEGDLDERGFVMDYAELEAIVDPLVAQLDHRFLNEIEGLEVPTTENMVNWFERPDGSRGEWPGTGTALFAAGERAVVALVRSKLGFVTRPHF